MPGWARAAVPSRSCLTPISSSATAIGRERADVALPHLIRTWRAMSQPSAREGEVTPQIHHFVTAPNVDGVEPFAKREKTETRPDGKRARPASERLCKATPRAPT